MDARVYPNPASEYVEIWSVYSVESITLTDALGRILTPGTESWIDGQEAVLDISGFRPGLYFLRFTTVDGKTKVHRVVKK